MAADKETGDKNAEPIMVYGKTTAGATVAFLVDADGIIQITVG